MCGNKALSDDLQRFGTYYALGRTKIQWNLHITDTGGTKVTARCGNVSAAYFGRKIFVRCLEVSVVQSFPSM